MTIKLTRIGIRVLMIPMMLVTAAPYIMAAAPYKLDTAHAEGAGVMRCPSPRGETQRLAIVFRDTYGVREKYTLSVAGKPLGEFEANLTDDDLIDGNRFWVWFSLAFSCQRGDTLEIAYSSDGKGVADILEIFFVKADQMDRLKTIISQESIAVRGRHLYTKLVSHYDHCTWQKVESNDAWVRVEAAAGCEFVKGFRTGHAEGGTRSLFVDFTAKVHAVKTWGYVEPISNRGTLTRPIVTMKCQFAGPRLFDGKEFWIATRGTTTHGGNQISPMFPMVQGRALRGRAAEVALRERKPAPPGGGGTRGHQGMQDGSRACRGAAALGLPDAYGAAGQDEALCAAVAGAVAGGISCPFRPRWHLLHPFELTRRCPGRRPPVAPRWLPGGWRPPGSCAGRCRPRRGRW